MTDPLSAPLIDPSASIDPHAVVDEGARVGARSRIWHFCHVSSGAQIGQDVSLGQNGYVAPGAVIGDSCRIQNNVSIYDGVTLEAEVFIGPSATFTNVRTPRAHVSRRDEYDTTVVERGASIGANATIICGVRLGAYCLIGAGSVVTRDVLPFALVTGNPARQAGWVCQCGVRLRAPEPRAQCLRCKAEYLLDDDELYWINEDAIRARMARHTQSPR